MQRFDNSTNQDTTIPDLLSFIFNNPKKSAEKAAQLAYEFSPLYAITAAQNAKQNLNQGNNALAAIDTIEGILSAIPLAGRTISKPLGKAAREVVEDRMGIDNSFNKIKQDLESNLGVTFENIHSHPTSAGYSKYFDVSKIDPESGEKLTKTIRFSDHLTGDVRAVNELQVFSEEDLGKLINKNFDEENFKKNINLQIENKTRKIEKEAQEKRTKSEINFFNNNLKKEERKPYIDLAMQELGIGLTKSGNFKLIALTENRELNKKIR